MKDEAESLVAARVGSSPQPVIVSGLNLPPEDSIKYRMSPLSKILDYHL
jgi:hypothetical protein